MFAYHADVRWAPGGFWHKHGSAHPHLLGDDGTHMGPARVGIFVELVLAQL